MEYFQIIIVFSNLQGLYQALVKSWFINDLIQQKEKVEYLKELFPNCIDWKYFIYTYGIQEIIYTFV